MSYNPVTDFIALLRLTGANTVRSARMPGLDFVVDAMYRAGMFAISIGQDAPTSNQSTTVWLRPAIPSWSAEASVMLWNVVTQVYELATPALWNSLLTPSGYDFQSVTTANAVITPSKSLVAVQRTAPVTTVLSLPTIATQFPKDLQIVDFPNAALVADHEITLTPSGGATIMQAATYKIVSTPVQLAAIRLSPSPDLNTWVIAP